MGDTSAVFERVVELCGFSAFVGPGAVRRSLAEAGCEEDTSSPEAFRRALPALRRRLEVYVSESDASDRIARIERYLDSLGTGAERGARAPATSPAKPAGWKDDETEYGKRRFGASLKILEKARDILGSDKDPKKKP